MPEQAFPGAYALGPNDDLYPPSPGMTLRDYFAAQALTGLMANSGGPLQSNNYSGWSYANCDIGDVAAEAYRIADAMLKVRG